LNNEPSNMKKDPGQTTTKSTGILTITAGGCKHEPETDVSGIPTEIEQGQSCHITGVRNVTIVRPQDFRISFQGFPQGLNVEINNDN